VPPLYRQLTLWIRLLRMLRVSTMSPLTSQLPTGIWAPVAILATDESDSCAAE